MPKGGRRSTTWDKAWKSGKTTVIRVPEALADQILSAARTLDEGGLLPVTDKNKPVTGNKEKLEEAAQAFLMTVQPRDRREAKKWIDRFIKSMES